MRIFVIGLAQKVLSRRRRSRLYRENSVRQSWASKLCRSATWNRCLYDPDLFRVCRLFQYGNRLRTGSKLYIAAQCSAPALHGALPIAEFWRRWHIRHSQWVLGLSLHPAGRKPRLGDSDLSQSLDGVRAVRTVARRQLDLHHLGAYITAFSSSSNAPGFCRALETRAGRGGAALRAARHHEPVWV